MAHGNIRMKRQPYLEQRGNARAKSKAPKPRNQEDHRAAPFKHCLSHAHTHTAACTRTQDTYTHCTHSPYYTRRSELFSRAVPRPPAWSTDSSTPDVCTTGWVRVLHRQPDTVLWGLSFAPSPSTQSQTHRDSSTCVRSVLMGSKHVTHFWHGLGKEGWMDRQMKG